MKLQGLSAQIAIGVAKVKEKFGRSEFSSFTALRTTRSDRSVVTGSTAWAPCLPLSVGCKLGLWPKAHILPHILFCTGVEHGTNGVSKSRWVADIIRTYAAHDWPQDCLALAGRFTDFPLKQGAPCTQPADVPRLIY
jgi:hypothetical protein